MRVENEQSFKRALKELHYLTTVILDSATRCALVESQKPERADG